MTKRFFTNYFIGGRGDFLNNCLYTGARDQYITGLLNSYAKLPPLALCVKTHGKLEIYTNIPNFSKKFSSWKELFIKANKHKLVKIKIVANTLIEKFDLAWMALNKVLVYDREHIITLTYEELKLPIPAEKLDYSLFWMFNLVYTTLDLIQNEDSEVLDEYDYIVNFNDLFDVDYIASLFQKINGKPMDSTRYESVAKNISIQDRLSTSEYGLVILEKYDEFLQNLR